MSHPPRWLRMWGHAVPAWQREFVLGDLEEQYGEVRSRRGAAGAAVWFIRHVTASAWSGRHAPPGHPEAGGAAMMDGVRQDISHGMRGLGRRPGPTAAIVATLALAIGLTTVMFSVVNTVLLRPLPFADPDRIVSIFHATSSEPDVRGGTSEPNFRDIEQAAALEAAARYRGYEPTLMTDGGPQLVPGGLVTERFFDVLGAALLVGRTFTREELAHDAPPRIVLSEHLWRNEFASDPRIVGRIVRLNGEGHEVIGVTAGNPDFPAGAQLWVNDGINVASCGRGCVVSSLIGRLAPRATLESFQAELDGIAAQLAGSGAVSENRRFHTMPLTEEVVGHVRGALYILLGAVALVLLIACANVANLLLATARRREREVAVRVSLGAGRSRIVRQFLTESVLLSAAGSVLGLGVAAAALRVVRVYAPRSVPRIEEVGLDPVVLGFTIVVLLGTALLFGLAPALRLAFVDPGKCLYGGRGAVGGGPGASYGRRLLIVTQVALSVVLLAGTGLLLRTLHEMRSVELGFDVAGLETFLVRLPNALYDGPDARVGFFAELHRQLEQIPGVEQVSGIAGLPLQGTGYFTSFVPQDGREYTSGTTPTAFFRPTLPGYFATMGIPLLRGRGFEARDRYGAPPVVILSAALAERLWPGQDPVGQRLEMHASAGYDEAGARTVVGVVADVRSVDVTQAGTEELYIPHAQSGSSQLSFVLRTTGGTRLQEAAALLRQMDPELPLRNAEPLTASLDRALSTPRFYSTLLSSFAALAIALAALGLSAVVAYQVAQRRQEIGVRLAIGADRADVVRLMAWHGFLPAIAGLGAGILVATAAVRLLSSLLFATSLRDPLIWTGVSALMLVITLIAATVPALRAARVAPAEALRYE